MDRFQEEYLFNCPYCAEGLTLPIDLTAGVKQEFVYDCDVCCHPIAIKVELSPDGILEFSAEKES